MPELHQDHTDPEHLREPLLQPSQLLDAGLRRHPAGEHGGPAPRERPVNHRCGPDGPAGSSARTPDHALTTGVSCFLSFRKIVELS